jgi:large subunit ribosomal protein L3
MNAIIGEKLGMTQIFDEANRAIAVTAVKAGPMVVTQIKRPETDGYSAVQVAFKEMATEKAIRPTTGHFAKAGLAPHRHLIEVRVDDPSAYELGQTINVGEVLEAGTKADVTGISKGKGFSGVMKRHNFKGQSASHGVHKTHRAPGAIGACATPARVFKGNKMPGRMGGDQRTMMNIDIVQVDAERNVVLLAGSVPGPKGAIVVVREAVKVNG